MNQFNLGNFLNKFVNYSFQNQNNKLPVNEAKNANAAFLNTQGQLNQVAAEKAILQSNFVNPNLIVLHSLRMNELANFERSVYLKDLMNLPKDLKEVLVLLQNTEAETSTSILNTQDLKTLLSTNINIANLAEIIQNGGKEAMSKLILAMSEASKQGITDLSQIKDAMKLINASVSIADKENPSQVLKNFMLLYLPWLPLQEGVDFELDIETSEGAGGEEETSLTITISTKNYNIVKALIIIREMNTFDILISCSDKFPKEELLRRIKEENKMHSINSEMKFEQITPKQTDDKNHQAKINMSQITQVNPCLLLLANAIIKNTIDLDNQAGAATEV